MTVDQQISHTERKIHAAKHQLQDLRSKQWQQWEKPDKQKEDFQPKIKQAEANLKNDRINLAKLIAKQYKISL